MIGHKRYFRYLFVFVLGVGFLGGCNSDSDSGNNNKEICRGTDLAKNVNVNEWNTVYKAYKNLDQSIYEYRKEIKEKGVEKVRFPLDGEVCKSLKILTITQIRSNSNDQRQTEKTTTEKNPEQPASQDEGKSQDDRGAKEPPKAEIEKKPINKITGELKELIDNAANGLNENEINDIKENVENFLTKTNFGSTDKDVISNYLHYKLFQLKLELYPGIPKTNKNQFFQDEIRRNQKEINLIKQEDTNDIKEEINTALIIGIGIIIILIIIYVIKIRNKDNQKPENEKEGKSTMTSPAIRPKNTTSEPIKHLRNELHAKLNGYITHEHLDNFAAKIIKELKEEIKQSNNNNNVEEIKELKRQISYLKSEIQKLQSTSSPAPTNKNPQPSKSTNNPTNPSLEKTNLPTTRPPVPTNSTTVNIVDVYNQNPANLSSYIEVLETTESIENRRLGVSQRPVIEKVRRNQGNYWVINVEGIHYLVPKAKLRVTEHIFSTLNILFDCHDYRDDYSKFTLIKPAEVTKSGENWELKEKGILEFE